ncbi:hypothetical protein HD806DRAFT_530676 [Xylariaceae sp. AK1471]|nr:hypothetical protein HD806DRAFT_530676 [Xylariaceae sp. AK1471]
MSCSSKRGVSPPPPYSSTPEDPEASSSSAPPPRYHSERTPLLIHQQPIIIVREPRNVVIRIGRRARLNREKQACAVILFATALALACSIWLLTSLPYFSRIPPLPTPSTYNVAIVGAGPAGIAAAQHLRLSSAGRDDVRFNITIFESKPVIGGVLAFKDSKGSFSVFPKDDPRQSPITAEDIAGKALMWSNALFTRDSEKILGDKVNFIELGHEQVGYYDDTLKTASAARPYSKTPIATWLSLLWTYGSSVWRAGSLAHDGDLREAMLKAPLVSDPQKILESLGVLKYVQQWASVLLRERSISERFATEILDPQVQRAYGQNLNQITSIGAMLAAAQEDSANAYMGGDLVDRLQRIVRKIDVDVRISTRVVGIKHQEIAEQHPAWLIQHESADAENGRRELSVEAFDKVIMAAADFGIRLESSDGHTRNLTTYHETDMNAEAAVSDYDEFVPVHITFFTSDAKLSPWRDYDQVLFIDVKKAVGIQDLALVRKIVSLHDGGAKTEYLYRVLSRSPVLEEMQNHCNISWNYQTWWPGGEGLWWTSLIQHAWTTVDLNWLAGKVVADDLIKGVVKE